jgi:lipopolysaccharide biosynthesis regulator YciM
MDLLIGQIRKVLGKLDARSKLSSNTQKLIILANEKVKTLEALGEEYTEVVNVWKKVRDIAKQANSDIKEQREIAYEELTRIVRKEDVIVELLNANAAKIAVNALQKVVEKLKKSQVAMRTWTDQIEEQLNPEDAGSPQ